MSLPTKSGLGSGGVGICKIGKGGALLARGSVTPGMEGIKGGRDIWGSGSGTGVLSARAARETSTTNDFVILLRNFERNLQ